MSTLQDLVIKVKGDTGDFEGAMTRAGAKAKTTGNGIVNSLGAIGGKVVLGGIAAAAAGIGALTGVLTACVKESMNVQKVQTQTAAVIKSTGGAAGMTAKSVFDLANNLSRMSGIDDDLIVSAENVLLTFTSIGKDVFPQATGAILDMSVALGQDLQSATIMVGKALQDPITGLTALRKTGVNFSDSQKAVITNLVNTGQSAQAQALIIAELNKEFGGSAEAAGTTFAGALGRAKTSIDNVKETIGNALIPILTTGADAFSTFLASDQVKKWSADFAASVKNVADKIPAFFDDVTKVVGWFRDNMQVVKGVITGIFVAMGVSAVVWAAQTVASIVSVAVAAGGSVIGALKGLAAAYSLMAGAKTVGAALSVAGLGAAGLTAVLLPLAIAITAVVIAWNKFIPKGLPAALDKTFVDHREHMLQVADSYAEYAAEMIRTGSLAGKFTGMEARKAEALLDGKLSAEQAAKATIELMDALNDYNESGFKGVKAQQGLNDMVKEGIPYFGYMGDALVESGQAAADTAQSIADLAAEQEALIASNLSDSLTNQMSLTLNLTDLTNDYKDKMAELRDEHGKLEDKLHNLQVNFPWDKEGIAQATLDLKNNQAEIDKTATAYDDATKRIVWDMVVAELALDGYTQAEFDWVLKSGVQMGILTQDAADLAVALRADADKNIKGFEDQQTALLKLQSREIHITTYYDTYGTPPSGGYGSGTWGNTAELYGSGGFAPANVPAIVGDRGWEMIIPSTNSQIISNDDILAALSQATGRVGGSQSISSSSQQVSNIMNVYTTRPVDEATITHGFEVMASLGME